MKTIRLVFLSLTLIACSVTPVRAGSATHARDAMAEGLAAYEAKDFERASKAFVKAFELASGTRLDAAVAHFNAGNALLGQGKPEEAASQFAEALRTTDLGLQQQASFNRGNALMAGAAALEAQQMLDPAVEAVNEAAAMYEQAMQFDPGDVDPKANYELALKKLEELEIKKEEQQQQQGQDEQQDQEQQDEGPRGDQEQQGDREQQNQDESSRQEQQDQPSGQQDQPQNGDDQDPEPQPDAQQGADTEREPMPSEEMTKDEAEMMLDAKREEERADREKVRMRLGSPQEVEKDW